MLSKYCLREYEKSTIFWLDFSIPFEHERTSLIRDLLLPTFKFNGFVSSFSRISLCHPDSHALNNKPIPNLSQSSHCNKLGNVFVHFPLFSDTDSKSQRLNNFPKFPILVNVRHGLEPFLKSYVLTIFHYLPATGMKAGNLTTIYW